RRASLRIASIWAGVTSCPTSSSLRVASTASDRPGRTYCWPPLKYSTSGRGSAESSSRCQQCSAFVCGSVNGIASWWALRSPGGALHQRGAPAPSPPAERVAGRPSAQPLEEAGVPAPVGHVRAGRLDPRDAGEAGAADGPAVEDPPPLEDRLLLAHPRHPPHE